MKFPQRITTTLQRVFASDPSHLDLSPSVKAFFLSFLYLAIGIAGYAAARAGNLADYGGGRWLYYSRKVLQGDIPFLDFYMDQGPVLAYLFAGAFALFGKNTFAVQIGLNLLFPLLGFLLYHLIAHEAFRDYRFRYGFLFLVWFLNLMYLPSLPAVVVPAGLLSVILLVRGWKQGDYLRLMWAGLLSSVLLYTDPYIGICALATNLVMTTVIFLFFDIPYHRRLLKFLILYTAFMVGIALINLAFYEPEAVNNYVTHFKALYFDSWIWYLGTPPSPHILFGLFFLIFFTHLSLFYFRVDREEEKLRKFLPLFAVIVFAFPTFFFLFYQSKGQHFFFWFPVLMTLFFLLIERYFLAAIPDAFSMGALRLRLSHLFPKMKSFQLLGHENFSVLVAIFIPPLLLFLFVVGPYPINRTAVTKYLINQWNSVENKEGILTTGDMQFNREEGVWMKRHELLDIERLEDYLKLNVRLYEETVFLPQNLYGTLAGFVNKMPFYSVENTFLREYQQRLLERWELFQPTYIVIDNESNYVHYSADHLLQKFDAFVEKHYRLEKRIHRYALLHLSEKPISASPYKSLNHEKSDYKGTTLLLQSTATFPLSPVAAIDISYTLEKPRIIPSFLVRSFLRLRFYRGEKEVAVRYITVPYTSTKPEKLRIKLRDEAVTADRVTIRVAEQSYTLLKPFSASLQKFEVFALKNGYQSISGISVAAQ